MEKSVDFVLNFLRGLVRISGGADWEYVEMSKILAPGYTFELKSHGVCARVGFIHFAITRIGESENS